MNVPNHLVVITAMTSYAKWDSYLVSQSFTKTSHSGADAEISWAHVISDDAVKLKMHSASIPSKSGADSSDLFDALVVVGQLTKIYYFIYQASVHPHASVLSILNSSIGTTLVTSMLGHSLS